MNYIETVKNSPYTKAAALGVAGVALGGTIGTMAGPYIVVSGLNYVGLTAVGPSAGGYFAGWMSAGLVTAGGGLASLQSAAMTGLAVSTGTTVGGLIGGVTGGWGLASAFTDKPPPLDPNSITTTSGKDDDEASLSTRNDTSHDPSTAAESASMEADSKPSSCGMNERRDEM